jgi:hypothetical protein
MLADVHVATPQPPATAAARTRNSSREGGKSEAGVIAADPAT